MQFLLLFHTLLVCYHGGFAKVTPHTEIPADTEIQTEISTNIEIHTEISTDTANLTEIPTDTAIHTDIPTDIEVHTEIPTDTPNHKEIPIETDIMKLDEELFSVCSRDQYSCESSPSFNADILPQRKCHCHSFCVNLRTCCFNSPYRHLTPTFPSPSCLAPLRYEDPIFMIDQCPDKTDTDLKQKCEMGRNDDFFMIVPVSSLATNMTYKNYFCFRCNEEHDEIIYWNVKLSAMIEPDAEVDPNVVPVFVGRHWMAPIAPDGSLEEIEISVEDRDEVEFAKKLCFPDVISNCSVDWKDDEIRQKCNYPYVLFTIFKTPGRIIYKNPNCALCNFENLDESICEYRPPHIRRKYFSFSMLLDINTSKCEEGHVWDSHFKKCRALKCALSGYEVKKDKCVKVE